jgi:putative transposase
MEKPVGWNNVIMERWFRSLKTEYVYINEYTNPRELRMGIRDYVEDYNAARPHQSLEYRTPDEAYYSKFAA